MEKHLLFRLLLLLLSFVFQELSLQPLVERTRRSSSVVFENALKYVEKPQLSHLRFVGVEKEVVFVHLLFFIWVFFFFFFATGHVCEQFVVCVEDGSHFADLVVEEGNLLQMYTQHIVRHFLDLALRVPTVFDSRQNEHFHQLHQRSRVVRLQKLHDLHHVYVRRVHDLQRFFQTPRKPGLRLRLCTSVETVCLQQGKHAHIRKHEKRNEIVEVLQIQCHFIVKLLLIAFSGETAFSEWRESEVLDGGSVRVDRDLLQNFILILVFDLNHISLFQFFFVFQHRIGFQNTFDFLQKGFEKSLRLVSGPFHLLRLLAQKREKLHGNLSRLTVDEVHVSELGSNLQQILQVETV